MEVAGLTAGILALAGLFNNAVDCFEYVQIGKAFEQDLDTCLLRLAAARLRLSRWGHAAGLERVTNEQSTSHLQLSLEEVEFAEGLMLQIIQLFNSAAEKSDGLLKRPKSTGLDLIAASAVEQSSMSRLTSIMRKISVRRTSKIGLTKKTKWALYQKGQFSGLVDSITDLVNDLIDLFPAAKESQPVLCLEEATELCNDTTITPQVNELQKMTVTSDPHLATAIEEALKQRSPAQQNTYYNNVNMSGTFYGQTQNIGVLYGGSTFDSKAKEIMIGNEASRPELPRPRASQSLPPPNVTIVGQFQDSNVIGYVDNLTFASDPLPKSAWTVPRAVNHLFLGRQDIAKILQSAFGDIDQQAEQRPKTFVINGLGGIGKSEVSIKYAFDNKNKYWGIFWIDCQDDATATESFELLGAKCHIPKPTINSVKAWLCSTEKRWLLIIDNADDPKQDYSKYLPATGRGHVIITTRLHDCDRYQTVGFLNLSMLAKPVARELLFNAADIAIKYRLEQQADADKILQQLAFHTLAIIHAGSYIRKSCSLSEYLEIFAKQGNNILNTPLGQEESTYRTVFATFEASAQRLEALQKSTKAEAINQVQAGDALDLLHTIAFMHNTGRYELIFSRARTSACSLQDNLTDVNQDSVENLTSIHASLLPEFCPSEEKDVELKIRWRQAYNTLEDFSFITITREGQSLNFSVHELVYVWARERQSIEQQRVSWQTAASIICLSGPTQRVDIVWTPTVNSFTPVIQDHARACAALVTEELLLSSPIMPILQSLFHLLWLNFESYEKQAFRRTWSHLQNMEPFIVECTGENKIPLKELQGHLYWRNNQREKATKEFEGCLDLARAYGWPEERTLRLQRNLARVYQLNRQPQKALTTLEHIREVQMTLDHDHPDRLGSLRLLAELYTDHGQADKAVPILEHIVTGENDFVQDHPEFFWARLDLANLYQTKDQSSKSVRILEPIFKLAGGDELKMAAEPLLIDGYFADGQVEKVVAMLERYVELEKKAAQRNPNGYRSRPSLKIAYDIHNNVVEALRAYFVDNQDERTQMLLEHIIKQSVDKFATKNNEVGHPTVYKYGIVLARVYLSQCKYAKALEALEELSVLEVLNDGWQHQCSLDLRWLLAKVYLATGRRREAGLCLEHIVYVQYAHWAGHVRRKFPVLVDIADDLRAEGSFDEAIAQYRRVADLLAESEYERNILLRLDVRCKLGMAYLRAGRTNEALDSLWEDFSYEIASLPADHPTQVATHYAYIQALNAVHGMNIVPEFKPEVNYGW